MTDINRRTVLKGAAWSIPVVAVAVATPLAAASQPTETEPPIRVCGGTKQDNGTYTVKGNILVIQYHHNPGIFEVNARGDGWSKSYGTNFGSAPKPGTKTWEIVLPGVPTWIQVHSFNAHLGENC